MFNEINFESAHGVICGTLLLRAIFCIVYYLERHHGDEQTNICV